jgi:hypothetical protein
LIRGTVPAPLPIEAGQYRPEHPYTEIPLEGGSRR